MVPNSSGTPQATTQSRKVCSECNAECRGAAQTCWLCHKPLDTKAVTPELKAIREVDSQYMQIPAAVTLSVAVSGIVSVGLLLIAPGIGFAFLLILAVVTTAVLVANQTTASTQSSGVQLDTPRQTAQLHEANEFNAVQAHSAERDAADHTKNIVIGCLSAIAAVLFSIITILMLCVISFIVAISAFFEACAELLQPK